MTHVFIDDWHTEMTHPYSTKTPSEGKFYTTAPKGEVKDPIRNDIEYQKIH